MTILTALVTAAILSGTAGFPIAPQSAAPPATQAPGQAELIESALAVHAVAQLEYEEIKASASERDVMRAAYEVFQTSIETCAQTLIVAVELDPSTSSAADACRWILTEADLLPEAGAAFESLALQHADKPFADEVVRIASTSVHLGAGRFIEAVILTAPAADSLAPAHHSLGLHLLGVLSLLEALAPNRAVFISTYGQAYVQWLESLDDDAVAALHARAIAQFRAIAASEELSAVNYGRGTYGDEVEGMLFEADHLAIGLVSPEIEGIDSAEVTFRLSDYRGQVVLLDFWGDW